MYRILLASRTQLKVVRGLVLKPLLPHVAPTVTLFTSLTAQQISTKTYVSTPANKSQDNKLFSIRPFADLEMQ